MVAPKVLERDESREYDVSLYKEMSQMGFIGLPYAKEFGGQGLSLSEDRSREDRIGPPCTQLRSVCFLR